MWGLGSGAGTQQESVCKDGDGEERRHRFVFNPVLEKDKANNKEEEEGDAYNCSILELMKQKKVTPSNT
eukprot:15008668-Ditylum_brightwellii.AAC.1